MHRKPVEAAAASSSSSGWHYLGSDRCGTWQAVIKKEGNIQHRSKSLNILPQSIYTTYYRFCFCYAFSGVTLQLNYTKVTSAKSCCIIDRKIWANTKISKLILRKKITMYVFVQEVCFPFAFLSIRILTTFLMQHSKCHPLMALSFVMS